MQYSEKFLTMANTARKKAGSVDVQQVDALIQAGAICVDIRDPDEHQQDHIKDSINISRGKLEMIVEGKIPDLNQTILCYCNANNRGALSAASLKEMGYVNAKYIQGGLLGYRKI